MTETAHMSRTVLVIDARKCVFESDTPSRNWRFCCDDHCSYRIGLAQTLPTVCWVSGTCGDGIVAQLGIIAIGAYGVDGGWRI